MATTLDKLLEQMNAQSSSAYTPLTDEQIKQKAQTRYDGTYGQQKLSAQQQYESNDQALAQQLAGLDADYQKQLEQSAKNFEGTYRAADRQMLGRGMQRSSYGSATLANINLEGAKAQQAIRDNQAAQAANIGEKRALLNQQLNATLAQLDAARQSDELAYMDELEAREYDRLMNDTQYRNQLAMQLYEYQFQKEQADLEQQRWQAEYDAAYGGGDGGYSGGGGYYPSTKKETDEDINDALGGGKTSATTNSLIPSILSGSTAVNSSVYNAVNTLASTAAKNKANNSLYDSINKKQGSLYSTSSGSLKK